MAFVALLDANVLYPAYLRDALLRLAEAEVYQVRWSRRILDEMSRNVLKNNPDLPEESMVRLVRTMERAFPDAMVTGHETLIPGMTNDQKDRHVLAAAIRGRADVIVTSNVRSAPSRDVACSWPPQAWRCSPAYDGRHRRPRSIGRRRSRAGPPGPCSPNPARSHLRNVSRPASARPSASESGYPQAPRANPPAPASRSAQGPSLPASGNRRFARA